MVFILSFSVKSTFSKRADCFVLQTSFLYVFRIEVRQLQFSISLYIEKIPLLQIKSKERHLKHRKLFRWSLDNGKLHTISSAIALGKNDSLD